MTLVLGLDPGTAITGYGLVREVDGQLETVDYGVIRTPADMPLPQRLQTIFHDLTALIQTHKPQSAAVEKVFFSSNAKTAMSVGHARGVQLLALAEAGLSIAEYTPNEVKQATVGYGGADKYQMQQMVAALLNLEDIPRPDDAADALAVAICHINTSHFQSLIDTGY
ncbi:MAG: crossover junction endodeoxyribonuclease RuvC [Anaerolineae bacterium]|nr:crossover junction endodeoxyribonuclease RuvC [Anaerolineae bacterium]